MSWRLTSRAAPPPRLIRSFSIILIAAILLAGNIPVGASPLPQTAPPCVPPPSGLVSWWRAEGDASDYMGLNNGYLVGGAAFDVGEVGQAFRLNGGRSYVSIPGGGLDPASITIEFWLNVAPFVPPSYEGIYALSKYGGWYNGYVIHIANDLRIRWSLQQSPSAGTDVYSSMPIAFNTWEHIAATYDGNTALLYINGVLVGAGTLPGGYTPSSVALELGSMSWAHINFMPGLMDEVSLYNHALSADEIQSIYNAGSAGKCLDNSISGRVTDADQNPISGVDVTADPGQGGTPLTAQTDANGDYTIASVPDGTYTVTALKQSLTFEPPSRTVTVPPNANGQDFIAVPRLSISAEPKNVWANGHETTTLTVRLPDAAGQGIPNHVISVSADPSDGVSVTPTSGTTDLQGEVVFTATSTKVAAVTFTATDSTDPTVGEARTDVEFTRRKIVVLFQGINTGLDCNQTTGECIPTDENGMDNAQFGLLRGVLAAKGFQARDILWYSYRGGRLDTSAPSRWISNDYSCSDTSNSYDVDILHLRALIRTYGNVNPNAEFYLVGHSQGGMLAFQQLGYLNSLPSATSIGAIFTLDSPLGGARRLYVTPARARTCWGNPAARQLIRVWTTASSHDNQGDTATPVCTIDFGSWSPECAYPDNVSMVQARGSVRVYTWGSFNDPVYYPKLCYPIPDDNRSTQVVSGSDEGSGIIGVPWVDGDCFANHSTIVRHMTGAIASRIGDQY